MTQLSRRRFLRGLAASVATVAVGIKLSHGTPKIAESYYAHERFSMGFTDHRAVYGSTGEAYAEMLVHSMKQTKEHAAANVLQRAFEGDFDVRNLDYTGDHLLEAMLEEECEELIVTTFPGGAKHITSHDLVEYITGIEDREAGYEAA